MIRVPPHKIRSVDSKFMSVVESIVIPRLDATYHSLIAAESGDFSGLENYNYSKFEKTDYIKTLYNDKFSLRKGKYSEILADKVLKFATGRRSSVLSFCEHFRESDELRKIVLSKPDDLDALLNLDVVTPVLENDLKWWLSGVFNYDILLDYESDSGSFFYWLSSQIGLALCPYCNRIYTHTVKRGSNGTKVTRPEFDHFYSKSEYPLFSVSLYNLVPVCSLCNHTKSGPSFTVSSNAHPYIDGMGDHVKFNIISAEGSERRYSISIVPSSGLYEKKLRRFKANFDRLGIFDIYASHVDEINDVLRKLSLLNKSNVGQIKRLLGDSISERDVLQFYFGVYLDQDNWGKRPFSKFIYDMIKTQRPELLRL